MKKIDWNRVPALLGAVWIQFKDSLPDANGWAYLNAEQTEYVFIGLSREYKVELFQEPNSIGKVYTNPALNNLVFNAQEQSIKVNPWDYDFDRSTELFVSNENPGSGSAQWDVYISERTPEENPWPTCGLGGTSPVPEGYHPPKMNRQEFRNYYEGVFKPFPDNSVPLLDTIKHSRRTLYQEELSDSEAQDILDRMRIDIEKAFGMPRKWL